MDVPLDVTENLEIDASETYNSAWKFMMIYVGFVDLVVNNVMKQ